MSTNIIIKFIIVIVLFVIGWNLENRTLSFIFFTLPWLIILFPFFFKKNDSSETVDSNHLYELSDEIHKKFHITCDVLKKLKSPIDKKGLVSLLELKGISVDKNSPGFNLRSIDLDIGNNSIFSTINMSGSDLSSFHKFRFDIIGIRDYQGLILSFEYEDKKRKIYLSDPSKFFGRMSKPMNQKALNDLRVGKHTNNLYDLILKKGNFDWNSK
jgi:hypothetical protein